MHNLLKSRAEAFSKPVLRRLMPLLSVILAMIIASGYLGLMHIQSNHLQNASVLLKAQSMGDLGLLLAEQARGLEALQVALMSDENVVAALKAGDRERLLLLTRPLFHELNTRHKITHFYFSDTSRICVLRVHKPEKHGDRFDRFTAREAERTGHVASGIELGTLGTFTLRVVCPVFEDGKVLGYVEFGKEIEDVLQNVAKFEDLEMIVVIRKDVLDRPRWEAGMAMLGRKADWDRLSQRVVIYSSMPLREEVEKMLCAQMQEHDHETVGKEISFDGTVWRFMLHPMVEVSGRDVGEILFLHDVTEVKAVYRHVLIIGGVVVLVLFMALLVLLFVVLRRVDAHLAAQQRKLCESESMHKNMISNIGDVIVIFERNGTIRYISPNVEKWFGWKADDAIGGSLYAHVHQEDADVMQSIMEAVSLTPKASSKTQLRYRCKSGSYKWIELTIVNLIDDASICGFLGNYHDITERKLAESQYKRELELNEILSSRIKIAMNSADMAWWETDMQTGDVLFDEKKTSMIGYDAHDFTHYMDFVNLVHPEDIEYTMEAMRKYLSGASHNYIAEYRILSKDGIYKWFYDIGSITARDEKGNPKKVAGIVIDITERKQMEREAQRLQELLSTTEMMGKVGGWEFATDTGIQLWTQEVYSILELDSTWVPTRHNWVNFYTDTSRPLIADALERIVNYDEPFDLELEILTAKGSRRNVHIIGKPDVAQRRVYGFLQDITDRMQAQELLRANESKLASILNSTRDVVWALSWPDLRAIYVSPSAQGLYGRPLQDFFEKPSTWHEVVHPDDRHLAESALQQLQINGTAERECRIIRPDGTMVWIYDKSTLVVDEHNRPIRIDGIASDITERKLAQQKLLDEQSRLEYVLSATGTGLDIIDIDYNLHYVNTGWQKVYGKPMGRKCYEYFNGLSEPCPGCGIPKALQTKHVVITEEVLTRENDRIVEVRSIPFRNADGQWLVAEVNIDVTERKRSEAALQQSRTREQNAARSKAEFADYVAHELRTPLTSMVATVEALQEMGASDEQRQYIDIINQSAEALTAVINQTLDFSRVQAGRITLECIPFDLEQVVKTRVQMHRQAASGKGLRITELFDATASRIVCGDPQRLGQVLSNLLGNAIKFTDTGEIGVEVACAEADTGWITARLRVIDTGSGIAPEAVPLLFERFSQECAATARTHGGSGLGLAICKLLVEQMGGSIGVESLPGKGSVFSFSVVLAVQPSEVSDAI
jgi:PAS domain S-box-containing protein